MSNGSHYDKFLTYDNFELAFNRLQTASRNLYKELYMHDMHIFGHYLNSNLKTLIAELVENTYEFGESIKYYLPKASGTVRPITLPSFTDLLIYQAIVNIIAQETVEEIKGYYNVIIYGNILNDADTKDSKFFYKPWVKQWKKYSELHVKYHESGYTYMSEFDISSFFDTVNHNILREMLIKDYKIDENLTDLLIRLLEHISRDSYRNNYYSSTGIPQGPMASFYLADLYLHYIDRKFANKVVGEKSKLKYIRYVDDIKIYNRNEIDRDKYLAQLDLLSRDIGLIPQASKIKKRMMLDPDNEIRQQFKSFSTWANEFKKLGSIKTVSHNKLKKKFIKSIKDEDDKFKLNEEGRLVYDKTILSFSMFKLNADEEVKQILIDYFYSFSSNIEGVLYYLNKHFSKDESVLKLLNCHLKNDVSIVRHVDAMIFKYFNRLPFDEEIFEIHSENTYWLVQYFLLGWLMQNDKMELLKDYKSKYSIVNRQSEFYKSRMIGDNLVKKSRIRELIKSDCVIEALSATYYYDEVFNKEFIINKNRRKSEAYNAYINQIVDNTKPDILNKYFGKTLNLKTNRFFNNTVFDELEYSELKSSWLNVINYMKSNPSIAFMNMNNFNHVMTNQLCKYFKESYNHKEYSNTLSGMKWDRDLLLYKTTFDEINNVRNQRTDSHSYDRDGNIRVRIFYKEFEVYFAKELNALKEVILFFENMSD